MSLSNQERIICKVVVDREIRELLDRGVAPDWFPPGPSRDGIKFILEYHDKYGTIPTKTTYSSHMGSSFKLVSVADPLEYLVDELARANKRRTLKLMQAEIEDRLADNDVDGAASEAAATVTAMGRFSPFSSRIVDSMDKDRIQERWEDYLDRESGTVLLGMPTGFPTIDETTLGLQPGQLITVLAQPKVGKTSLCLAIGNHAYGLRKKVLFASFEMGIREMEMRQEALMARINFRNLQDGKLTKLEKKKYEDYLDGEATNDVEFLFMDASAGSTVSAMRGQVDRLEPDLIILDGIYMMQDEVTGEVNTPQALTSITRSLKRMATQVERPIVINTQALAWKSKGQKITMDSAGYSSSFAQDSDVVLGLEMFPVPTGEDTENYMYQRVLKILASRNTGLATVDLDFDYSEGRIEEMGV